MRCHGVQAPERVALRLIVIAPCADMKLIAPVQALAPMRVIVPVPVEGGFWHVTVQVAVLADIAKLLFTHVASGPLPAGGCVHCCGEQTVCGAIGIDTPCIDIDGVTVH